jgi:hypothetical protein
MYGDRHFLPGFTYLRVSNNAFVSPCSFLKNHVPASEAAAFMAPGSNEFNDESLHFIHQQLLSLMKAFGHFVKGRQKTIGMDIVWIGVMNT